ncbi:Hypothetical_protein [Hexamita inflata]|uniref:Hypothetical_protein n=1 Tax=Hexamita inflata TaxID=28002 RepID=A0AA86UQQ5_9EUKA|nr:Hypothetical protein HINF_LOCUS48647 [Hexamita inflata]
MLLKYRENVVLSYSRDSFCLSAYQNILLYISYLLKIALSSSLRINSLSSFNNYSSACEYVSLYQWYTRHLLQTPTIAATQSQGNCVNLDISDRSQFSSFKRSLYGILVWFETTSANALRNCSLLYGFLLIGVEQQIIIGFNIQIQYFDTQSQLKAILNQLQQVRLKRPSSCPKSSTISRMWEQGQKSAPKATLNRRRQVVHN